MTIWITNFLPILLTFPFVKSKHEIIYTVQEESENGTFIGDILADSGSSDLATSGGDIGVQLYEDQFTGLFQVDGKTGKLTVAGRIDREAICPQRGGISSIASFSPGLVANSLSKCQIEFIAHIPPDNLINIAVTIEDINDHAPRFKTDSTNQLASRTSGSSNIVYISEGVSVGYEVPINGATDEDAGSNGIQSYSLSIDDDDNATFALRYVLPSELNLIVKKKLDYEKKSAYSGQIKSCDGGKPTPKCAVQNITIVITDINDNKPHFDKDLYTVRISEATPVSSVIISVSATDADSGELGRLTYRFGQTYDQNVGAFFGVNENTGDIWVKSPLDAKVMSHFKFPVTAQDGGTIPKTGSTMVQVDIDDVNNHSPWIEIKPISSPLYDKKPTKDGYVQLWIEENQPVGTQIGIILTGDKDVGPNGDVLCNLKDKDSPFRLRHSSSGRGRKMYSLQSKVQFDLEGMNLKSPIILQVECSDFGNPKLVTKQNIQVNVVDVNEFPAFFTKVQSNIIVHIPEDTPPGSLVVKIQATDRDDTPKMEFRLENDHGGLFIIDSANGNVFTQEKFDREVQSQVHFSVRLLDSDISDSIIPREECDLANVTVILDDVNDNSPVLESGRTFNVFENRAAYVDLIGQLRAYDPDLGENGTVRFLTSNNLFDVNPVTGKIYSKAILDREAVAQYQLDIEITDLGRPVAKRTIERISINVDDVNDNRPVWKIPEKLHREISIKPVNNVVRNADKNSGKEDIQSIGFVNISSQASEQSEIVKLVATDADIDQNANISFSILNGNYYSESAFTLSKNNVLNLIQFPQQINIKDYFSVDPLTWVLSAISDNGVIKPKSGLYEILLWASDNGQPPLHTDALIFVYYEYKGGFVANLFSVLNRGKTVILVCLVCLFICMVLCPVLIYLVRTRRKSQECCDRGIIACVDDERIRQKDVIRVDNTEVENWAKEQMFMTQQPYLNSFDIPEDMNCSILRYHTDQSAINYGQSPHLTYQGCSPVTAITVSKVK
nr:protocadherin 11 [Hymenolepis microstoma]